MIRFLRDVARFYVDLSLVPVRIVRNELAAMFSILNEADPWSWEDDYDETWRRCDRCDRRA